MPTTEYDPSAEFNCDACDKPDNFDNLIQCEKCEAWLHYCCAKISDEFDKSQSFSCEKCESSPDGRSEVRTPGPTQAPGSGNLNVGGDIQLPPTTNNSVPADNNNGSSGTGGHRKTTTVLSEDAIEMQRLQEMHELEIKFLNMKYELKARMTKGADAKGVRSDVTKPSTQQPGTSTTKKLSIQEFEQPTPNLLMTETQTELLATNRSSEPQSLLKHFERTHISMSSSAAARTTRLSSDQLAARKVLDRVKLPVFDGRPEDWLRYICNYEQTTAACGYSNVENLGRLNESLRGAALEHVSACLCSPDMVPVAIETLRMIYGNPDLIVSKMRSTVLQVPPVKNMSQCIEFSIKVQHLCVAIESIMVQEYLYDYSLIQELV